MLAWPLEEGKAHHCHPQTGTFSRKDRKTPKISALFVNFGEFFDVKKDSSFFRRFAPRQLCKTLEFLKAAHSFLVGNCPPIKAECRGQFPIRLIEALKR
jgi:hypothetical protein